MHTLSQRVIDELKKGPNLSIIELINTIILHAYQLHASDIHIDPQSNTIKLRLRIDGVLHTAQHLPKSIYNEVISRIKVLSNLRTDEHQAAQDGRFRVGISEKEHIDIRVSIVPTYHGENIVLRLLTENEAQITLEALGYRPEECHKILKSIKRPHGMILITGPTGSGKTTTLYTFLKLLNCEDISIITIEDPVEYSIEGITQIQTNPGHGLTFASGLRSMLRQDPDLIMVGEIRDSETATIAINTALTGHLIFSTLHTSDAVTTLPRLHDMGIESYLIASTVNLLIGQRLLRKNCTKCSIEKIITDIEKISLMEILPERLLETLTKQTISNGCEDCNHSGFKGRISINEVLIVDDQIREAIMKKESKQTLTQLAIQNGMVPMLEDGLLKVTQGKTTIAEVLRVIHA